MYVKAELKKTLQESYRGNFLALAVVAFNFLNEKTYLQFKM